MVELFMHLMTVSDSLGMLSKWEKKKKKKKKKKKRENLQTYSRHPNRK